MEFKLTNIFEAVLTREGFSVRAGLRSNALRAISLSVSLATSNAAIEQPAGAKESKPDIEQP